MALQHGPGRRIQRITRILRKSFSKIHQLLPKKPGQTLTASNLVAREKFGDTTERKRVIEAARLGGNELQKLGGGRKH